MKLLHANENPPPLAGGSVFYIVSWVSGQCSPLGAAADVILKAAGNRCKMKNCVATRTGKESFLRMLGAKKIKNSFTLLWLNTSRKVP